MRVLDLFSGIGGFSLGLERAGMTPVAFCEISPKCRHLLATHWPTVPCFDDVTTLTGEQVGPVDVICGGFPCQDISFAGKGAGLAGERSGLWREYARLIGELRPAYVIVENVAALLGRGLGDVLGDLAALRYDAWWDCIPAAAVGAPHRRDRLWLVAYPGGVEHEGHGDALRREIAAGLSRAAAEQGVCAGHDSQAHAFDPDADRLGSHRAGIHVVRDAELRDEQVGLFEPLGGDVADASCELRNGSGTGAEQDGRPEPANGRSEMADTLSFDAQGLVSGEPHTQGRPGPIERPPGSRGDGLGWWSTEPDVGRVAHGVPFGLDGTDGSDEEHDPEAGAQGDGDRRDLSGLRSDRASGAAPPELRDAGRGRGALRALPCEGGSAGRDAEGEGDESLHDLRCRLPADAQQEAHDLLGGMSGRGRPAQRRETLGHTWSVEPDIPRVAHGVEARVDRLHGLGNAVVPQIPEIIGRAIMSAQASLQRQDRAA